MQKYEKIYYSGCFYKNSDVFQLCNVRTFYTTVKIFYSLKNIKFQNHLIIKCL